MSADLSLSIGAAAKRTGCSVPTIRYYETIGLLPAAPRTDGNQRHYGKPALQRLAFIRRCRDFGFNLDQVRELVGLLDEPARNCAEARDIAQVHLRTVEQKLAQLQLLQASLAGFVRGCDAGCAGGPASECNILEDLAQPAMPVSARPGCCG